KEQRHDSGSIGRRQVSGLIVEEQTNGFPCLLALRRDGRRPIGDLRMWIEVHAADGAVVEGIAAVAGWPQTQHGTEQRAAQTTVRHHDDRPLAPAMTSAQQRERLGGAPVEDRFLVVALTSVPPPAGSDALVQRYARPLAQDLLTAQPGMFV